MSEEVRLALYDGSVGLNAGPDEVQGHLHRGLVRLPELVVELAVNVALRGYVAELLSREEVGDGVVESKHGRGRRGDCDLDLVGVALHDGGALSREEDSRSQLLVLRDRAVRADGEGDREDAAGVDGQDVRGVESEAQRLSGADGDVQRPYKGPVADRDVLDGGAAAARDLDVGREAERDHLLHGQVEDGGAQRVAAGVGPRERHPKRICPVGSGRVGADAEVGACLCWSEGEAVRLGVVQCYETLEVAGRRKGECHVGGRSVCQGAKLGDGAFCVAGSLARGDVYAARSWRVLASAVKNENVRRRARGADGAVCAHLTVGDG